MWIHWIAASGELILSKKIGNWPWLASSIVLCTVIVIISQMLLNRESKLRQPVPAVNGPNYNSSDGVLDSQSIRPLREMSLMAANWIREYRRLVIVVLKLEVLGKLKACIFTLPREYASDMDIENRPLVTIAFKLSSNLPEHCVLLHMLNWWYVSLPPLMTPTPNNKVFCWQRSSVTQTHYKISDRGYSRSCCCMLTANHSCFMKCFQCLLTVAKVG
jgi:hypothetical protein